MVNLFSRQQALDITGLSSGQLSRLDKSGIVRPTKLGSKAHPTVLYELNQIRELRIIATLRQKLSMQEIKKVVQHIRDHDYDRTLLNKFLVFSGNKLYWIQPDEFGAKIIELSGKNKGQVVLKAVPPIGDTILDLNEEIRRHQAADSSSSSSQKTTV